MHRAAPSDNDQDHPFPALEQWRGYVEQIAGYVRGLKADYGHSLPRAVLTSGQWMVIFTDPVKTFVEGPAEVDQFEILMWHDYVKRASFLFKQLLQSILGPTSPAIVRPGQIPYYCSEPAMVSAFKALHVRYEATGSRLFARKPRIIVYPALILQRHDGALIPVAEDVRLEFGYRKDPDSDAQDMAPHLAEVDTASVNLLARCEAACGHALPLSPIEQFPGFQTDHWALGREPTTYVQPDPEEPDTWLIATWTASHFVKVAPGTACNFYSWASCHAVDQAIGNAAVTTPTTKSPRSFFVDGQAHHCAHLNVLDLRNRRGHIAPIDRRLCCQACVLTERC